MIISSVAQSFVHVDHKVDIVQGIYIYACCDRNSFMSDMKKNCDIPSGQ